MSAKCKVGNCNNTTIIGFGYCNRHYLKFKRWGDPLYVYKRIYTEKFCTIEGCSNKIRCIGLCDKHYSQKQYEKRTFGRERTRLPDSGRRKLPEYRIWAHIKGRCNNPKTKCWKNYGGRGITICDRWLNNFDNFLEDMGKRPTPDHQIDRINNNGNYEPSNCRWVSQLQNARNKRVTLTEHQVKEIRKHLYMGLQNLEVESITGVSRTKISNIKCGYTYINYGLINQIRGVSPYVLD